MPASPDFFTSPVDLAAVQGYRELARERPLRIAQLAVGLLG